MRNSSGQVLLITLLVLTVIITIGLALIGRTRTDITSTAEVEESARAFSAAEAGIEEALQNGVGGTRTLAGQPTSYTTSIAAVGAAAGSYAFPQVTKNGETETLWLVPHNPDQTLNETRTYTSNLIDVCWKKVTDDPALVVTVLYKDSATLGYQTAKLALDPIVRGNNFDNGNLGLRTGCGQSNVHRHIIDFSADLSINPASDTLLALRLRPVYGDAFLYVDSGASILPSQGNLVTSSGSTGTGVTRKIVVTQQYRSALSIFDAAVVSQEHFSK